MRTTVADIKIIIDTQLSDSDIEAIAGHANRLIGALLDTNDLSEARLTDIETYLTAHFISMSRERQATDEKIGEASIKYAGKYEKYLQATSYGQMVMMLDTTGKLAKSVGKSAINITSL